MYRTPVKYIDTENKIFTTDVLDSYKSSFESYLNDMKCVVTNENSVYSISSKNQFNLELKDLSGLSQIDSSSIIQDFLQDSGSIKTFDSYFNLTIKDISILPLISWLRYNDNKKEADFSYYYMLACDYLKKYL